MMNHSNSSLKQLCALALLAFLLAGFQFPDNSLLQGLKKAFYENGQMESEKHYKNGVLNGPAKVYYENGHLAWEGFYNGGQLDGTSKFYFDSGALEAERTYAYGVETG